MGKWTV
jgi:hypothetical protein